MSKDVDVRRTFKHADAYNKGWRYVVWVGGCDDYYVDYSRAKEHYDEWIEQGYDGVQLMKLMGEA
tara:strand:- start:592 stop:786 length:195 start_codon:yes stop_codon:yes gene_type:complete